MSFHVSSTYHAKLLNILRLAISEHVQAILNASQTILWVASRELEDAFGQFRLDKKSVTYAKQCQRHTYWNLLSHDLPRDYLA